MILRWHTLLWVICVCVCVWWAGDIHAWLSASVALVYFVLAVNVNNFKHWHLCVVCLWWAGYIHAWLSASVALAYFALAVSVNNSRAQWTPVRKGTLWKLLWFETQVSGRLVAFMKIIIIFKVFVKRKILSIDTVRSAYTCVCVHTHTHTHTHTA